MVHIKRIYDPPDAEDGMRILVDGIWPRGISKAAAALDLWMRQLAPSTALRQWFGHDPQRWQAFQQRYRDELAGQPEKLTELLGYCRRSTVTLLYGARDQTHNQARVLRDVLMAELAEEQRPNELASSPCWATKKG